MQYDGEWWRSLLESRCRGRADDGRGCTCASGVGDGSIGALQCWLFFSAGSKIQECSVVREANFLVDSLTGTYVDFATRIGRQISCAPRLAVCSIFYQSALPCPSLYLSNTGGTRRARLRDRPSSPQNLGARLAGATINPPMDANSPGREQLFNIIYTASYSGKYYTYTISIVHGTMW